MWRTRLRTLEAIVALLAAHVLVRALPFAVFRSVAGRVEHGSIGDRTDAPPTNLRARGVANAIARGAWRLPMPSTCLVKAVAGRFMLSRRRLPSCLVLGVSSRGARTRAHAWLLAGGGAVCGGDEASEFSPIAVFRHTAQR